jgi:hypothetical protein
VTFRAIISRRRFWAIGSAATRLKLAQGVEQRFDFTFVGDFLTLGKFDQFQYFLHLFQCLPQRFDNLHHFVDGLTDGGIFRSRNTRRMNGGLKSGARRHRLHWGLGLDDGCFGLRHRQFFACRESFLCR